MEASNKKWLSLSVQLCCISLGVMGYRSYRSKCKDTQVVTKVRPSLVLQAIEKNEPIYYFGLGSNMSRTKLENRSGKKIEIISMEPCLVQNYRLGFCLRGMPPVELSMGSLEPSDNNGTELLKYQHNECHGALICISIEDYERLYLSEGGGKGGYEEIVVTCVPYDETKQPIEAVAYRALPSHRLINDAPPSLRYMTILRSGAEELGIRECYRRFLDEHPTHESSKMVRELFVFNLYGTIFVRFAKSSFPFLSKVLSIQDRLLYIINFRSFNSLVPQLLWDTLSCMVLLPGASCGCCVRLVMSLKGNNNPGLLQFIQAIRGEEKKL